jgi:hypothetical protein
MPAADAWEERNALKKRTAVIAAGSVVVVAAATVVTVVLLNRDDGQPLPTPAVGRAVSYSLDVPVGSGSHGGHFPLDGARVALSDHGAVFHVYSGNLSRVYRLSSSGHLSELSGITESDVRPVSVGDKVLLNADGGGAVTQYDPANGSMTSSSASGMPTAAVPIGAQPDGTVLVADYSRQTIWALKQGVATQFADFRGTKPSQQCLSALDTPECAHFQFDNVVADGKGVVYALEKHSDSSGFTPAPLSTLLTVSAADAAPTPVTLPSSISGVQGDPGALRTLAVTGADDGVYALVEAPGGDYTAARYVLHIHGGSADVVGAQPQLAGGGTAQCSFKGAVNPMALPCLPDDTAASLAYGDGRLLVAGWLDVPNNSSAGQTANVVIGVRG